MSEQESKLQICEIGRRIWQRGFCAGNEGNHSVRIAPDKILCTPSGFSKNDLSPDDICTVDPSGKQLTGRHKCTSEIHLHLAIYRARKDISAVIHSHPPHVAAFAITGSELPTGIYPEAEIFLGPVPTAPYVTPGDSRLGESVLPFVNDSNTIILQNHGVVTFAPTLLRAYHQLEIVDAYAKILILAKSLGEPRRLTDDQIAELRAMRDKF